MANPVTFPSPVQLGRLPTLREGTKVVYVHIGWQSVYDSTHAFVDKINLLSQYQTGQFTTIQAVYVDNQTCPETVTLTCVDTGQTIRIPPFAKGMYPLLTAQAPLFTVELDLTFDPNYGQAFSACSTSLFFLNTPQRSFEAAPANLGQNFNSYSGILNGYTPANIKQVLSSTDVGSGMVSLGNNQYYALSSMNLDIAIIAGALTATPALVIPALLEVPGLTGPSMVRWWGLSLVPASAGPQNIYSRTFVWPTPIIQINPDSDWWFQLSGLTGTTTASVVINLTYSVVTIQ